MKRSAFIAAVVLVGSACQAPAPTGGVTDLALVTPCGVPPHLDDIPVSEQQAAIDQWAENQLAQDCDPDTLAETLSAETVPVTASTILTTSVPVVTVTEPPSSKLPDVESTVEGSFSDVDEAIAAACAPGSECVVVWPSDGSQAPDMPTSIPGYEPDGSVERSFLAVYGQGSVSKLLDLPYLLGDCASRVWTAQWRVLTNETVHGAVIPPTPENLFQEPWNPAWGDLPEPSVAGLLVGHGCSQPAWTDPPEANLISDIVVDWQLWEASP